MLNIFADVTGSNNANSRTQKICGSVIALAICFGGGAAVAQTSASAAKPATKSGATRAPEPMSIKLERKKVTQVDGKELLVAAAEAKPGEVIEETATYANTSKKNLRADATLPVPQYTELIVASVKPSNVFASIDGTTFSPMPLKRKVKQANGVVLEQVVPVIEYRFLRWKGVDLGPEKTFVASARFRLYDSTAIKAPG